MSILIGLIDQRIQDSQPIGWDTNKIGGLPAWISSATSLPECKNCGKTSSLVAQLYCPLGGSSFHRCLYLFVCPGECSKQQNGWRVFRSMKHDSSYQHNTDQVKKTSSTLSEHPDELWTQEQDDWGEDPDICYEETYKQVERSSDSVEASGATGQVLESASMLEENYSNVAESMETSKDHFTESKLQHAVSKSDVFKTALLQGTDSMSQLRLSDDIEQHDDDDDETTEQEYSVTASSSVLPAAVPGATYDCDNTENLLEVDTIMLTDTERWDAMAKLLNTKLEQAPEPTRTNTDCTIVFEPYYLSVVDEPSDQSESYDHVNDLIRNYERSEGKQLNQLICERSTSSKGREGPSELYEKSELKHGDRIFYKFLKRLQKCPQQCVRYERGGSPLLVSGLTEQTIKRCSHCGGEFIFELQLLPPLIPFLKAQNGTPCEVEFGTVLIFTCERNCWPAEHDQYDLLEELIVLQGDPDIHLYR